MLVYQERGTTTCVISICSSVVPHFVQSTGALRDRAGGSLNRRRITPFPVFFDLGCRRNRSRRSVSEDRRRRELRGGILRKNSTVPSSSSASFVRPLFSSSSSMESQVPLLLKEEWNADEKPSDLMDLKCTMRLSDFPGMIDSPVLSSTSSSPSRESQVPMLLKDKWKADGIPTDLTDLTFPTGLSGFLGRIDSPVRSLTSLSPSPTKTESQVPMLL